MSDRRKDGGFTLLEMLIVVVMMATIAGAFASTISIVLRASPAAETDVVDARSVKGLVTWLPQDIDAAPPDGLNTDVAAWPCDGAAPANSFNVLEVVWTEKTDVTTNYASTYRYEFNGDTWHLVRYVCDDATTATMSAGTRLNLTSELPPWDNLAPPAKVTMCDAAVDNSGACPSGSEVTTSTSPSVESLKFQITRLDGVPITIDAAPKNPDQDLADDPNASTNASPTISQTDFVVNMFAGDTVTIDLITTHNPTDADGDALGVAIDSSEPAPPGVTASTIDPLFVELTTDPSLLPGTISTKLVLIISDPRAGWVDATLTVNILPEPNLLPTMTTPVYNLQIAPGSTLVLPLDVTHGISDPNGDTLSATVVAYPPSLAWSPTTSDPARPLDLTIQTKPSAAIGPAASPIEVEIDDGGGTGVIVARINVEIVAPFSNNPPTVTSGNVDINMQAGETVTLYLDASHGASDLDSDPLSTFLDSGPTQPSEITTNLVGGLQVELTADPSVIDGPLALPVALEIRDPYGDDVDITISITIVPTPTPPSDCVLGTLSATPSSVDRQGGGSSPRHLKEDVSVTLTYSGSCDGLVLKYDTGDTSGLGIGTGRVFPVGSPSTIVIYGKNNGGTEKWLTGSFTLIASTTSVVTPDSVTTTLTVN